MQHKNKFVRRLYGLAVICLFVSFATELRADCPGQIIYYREKCSCGQMINASACQSCFEQEGADCLNCANFIYCCSGNEAWCLAGVTCESGQGPVRVQLSDGRSFVNGGGCVNSEKGSSDANAARK